MDSDIDRVFLPKYDLSHRLGLDGISACFCSCTLNLSPSVPYPYIRGVIRKFAENSRHFYIV